MIIVDSTYYSLLISVFNIIYSSIGLNFLFIITFKWCCFSEKISEAARDEVDHEEADDKHA